MRSPHLALLATTLLLAASPALMSAASPDPSAEPTGTAPPTASPPTLTLEGTLWRLRQLRLSGAFGDVPPGIVATLQLDAGTASGSGGCNSFFASYLLEGAAITFGPVGSTKMACPEPRMSVETFYLADLASVASWAIEDTTLRLLEAGGETVLAFEAPPPTAGIEGIDWQLTQLLLDSGPAAVPEGFVATLRIEDGQAGGSSGCNIFGGPVTIDASSLTIGALAMTEMACADPRMNLEAAYLGRLAQVASYQLDGSALRLLDAAGTVLLVFAAPAEG
jgi:heat shock protein HslJ